MAIQIIREVHADVVKRGVTRAVYAKQNDYNSRFLNVRIQEDGHDIVVKSSATVILNVERPDKERNMFYGTVNDDGTVKIPMTSWMLELSGNLLCDISIVAEDTTVAKLTTMQFNIFVEDAVNSDESFSETEDYSVIVDLLNKTSEAATVAAKAREDAEYLRGQCEQATSDAQEAAKNANGVRAEIEAGGFIESLKEMNTGDKLTFWVGTKSEYDALPKTNPGTVYVIADDPTIPAIFREIELIKSNIDLLTKGQKSFAMVDARGLRFTVGSSIMYYARMTDSSQNRIYLNDPEELRTGGLWVFQAICNGNGASGSIAQGDGTGGALLTAYIPPIDFLSDGPDYIIGTFAGVGEKHSDAILKLHFDRENWFFYILGDSGYGGTYTYTWTTLCWAMRLPLDGGISPPIG